jgi:mono/diheme cytochrome c family protein
MHYETHPPFKGMASELLPPHDLLRRTSMTPAQFTMPAFAWRLTDQDAADIISFIRSSWGNDAKPIERPKVAALRSSIKFA